jgi:thiazole synthase
MSAKKKPEKLKIGNLELTSRLIVGTGKYADFPVMKDALLASGTEMVTVAIRRVDLSKTGSGDCLLDFIPKNIHLLPNTAGCYTVEEAVRAAHLAREACGTPLIKLEVIGDQKTLLPDVVGTLEACSQLVKEGFTVMPYTSEDPIVARKLEEAGAAVVMPLASPIGSGRGVINPYNVYFIMEAVNVPVIVDAGVGTASDAAIAMELGVDGLLINTGIAQAKDPVKMATAMKLAVEAGRLAFLAGRIPKKLYGSASSPIEGVVE